MTIPVTKDLEEIAKNWKNQLDQCLKKCTEAKTNIDSNREFLVLAHKLSSDLVTNSAALALAGYPDTVIGPIVGKRNGVNWNTYKIDWDELKETLLPALVAVIKLHEIDVVRGTVNVTDMLVLNHPLPAQARTDIIAALDAVIAKFA